MTKKKPYARIAITLPQEVLAAADRHARQLDRSRSWLVAEAVRQFTAAGSPRESPTEGVREAIWSPYATSLAELARLKHLESQAGLTPEECLHRAEELLQLAPVRKGSPLKQVVGFASWDDFAQWKRGRRFRP
jgi:hypothetical protein